MLNIDALMNIVFEKQLEQIINELEINATIHVDQENLCMAFICKDDESVEEVLKNAHTLIEDLHFKLGFIKLSLCHGSQLVLELEAQTPSLNLSKMRILELKDAASILGYTSDSLAALIEDNGLSINLKGGKISISLTTFQKIATIILEEKQERWTDTFLEQAGENDGGDSPEPNTNVLPIQGSKASLDVVDLSAWVMPATIKKTNTLACVKAAIEYLNTISENDCLELIVSKKDLYKSFVEQMGERLKHHASKDSTKKQEEVRKVIKKLQDHSISAA